MEVDLLATTTTTLEAHMDSTSTTVSKFWLFYHLLPGFVVVFCFIYVSVVRKESSFIYICV